MRVCQHSYTDYSLVAECLLKNGANANLNNESQTAIMIACIKNRNDKCVQALIDNGADFDLQDKHGQTALMLACKNGHNECAEVLIQNGVDKDLQDNKGNSAVMIACDNGYSECVESLIRKGANIDLQDNDHEGRSALMRLCDKQGNDDIFRLLLESCANVNLQDQLGKTALMIAIASNHNKAVSMLLEHGAHLDMQDNEGNTALITAASKNNLSSVEILVNKGADMNIQNKQGRNPLMIACNQEARSYVKLLVERGVDTNLQDNEGLTALIIASERGEAEIIELLTSRSQAKVDLQDHKGKTALMHIVESLKKSEQLFEQFGAKVITLLIEYGANIDLQDNSGWSALMMACQNGHVKLSSMLLDKGANSSLKNNEGLTAFDIAKSSKNRDLFSLFSKLRSDPSFPGILFYGGVRKESITATEKDIICLEDAGISLSIPKDALPSTDPPLDIQIQPCFSGSFEMPENVQQVSPAYIVSPSRKVAFQKEVLVKIWHHANLETEEDCEDMVFLSASTSPQYRGDTPVYTFREIRGATGSFRPGKEQPAGQIALKHFCILLLGKRTHTGSDDSPQSKRQRSSSLTGKLNINKQFPTLYFIIDNLYSARLYAIRQKVIFCICLCQPQYIKVRNMLPNQVVSQEQYIL